jgi:DedD protein
MSTVDRRLKERLLGASILMVLIVLIVPELLSGPRPAPAALKLPTSTPEPVRNITVDLTTAKALAPESLDAAASSAQPPDARNRPAASAPAASAAPAGAATAGQAAGVDARAASSARLETRAPAPTSAATAAKPVASTGAWAVQLGSFASRANADKLMRQLKGQGFAAYMVPGGSGFAVQYRVRVGPMADRNAAAQTLAKLKASGHTATVVRLGP